jgi:DUF4097 and DUF4098 domain-containing protein YvlB
MNKLTVVGVITGLFFCVAAIIAGCIVIGVPVPAGGILAAEHERTEQISAPLPPGGSVSVMTHNGSITVSGAETEECTVTAKIRVRAGSAESAKKLAQEVKVRIEPSGDKLLIRHDKPSTLDHYSITISFEVTVPKDTALELTSYNGQITIQEICAPVKAHTHNGRIVCRDTSGDLKLKTYNGKVDATHAPEPTRTCSIDIVSHNGKICLAAPKHLSASADVHTHNGAISTELPISVSGMVRRNRIQGTIGEGDGDLRLRTYNGSITIKTIPQDNTKT